MSARGGEPDLIETTAPCLAVDRLTVGFGPGADRTILVDDVSFRIEQGRTLCLVGESGCGKSLTALSIMGLLSTPLEIPAGRVAFEGRDLNSLSQRQRADLRGDAMTMIFQEPMTSLNPAFSIGDQIAEGVIRHRGLDRKAARAVALDMLTKVRIPDAHKRLDDYPHQLSGGMRQRVMIAMALANGPKLLIADEPTTALDVTIQAQILALIKTLQKQTATALLLITHDLGVVAEIADDVAVMYAGRIVEQGPVADIFADPQHPYTLGLLGSMPALAAPQQRLITIPGSVPAAGRRPSGCGFAPRCRFALPACTAAPPPLRAVTPVHQRGHRVACLRAPLEDNVPSRPRTAAVATP